MLVKLMWVGLIFMRCQKWKCILGVMLICIKIENLFLEPMGLQHTCTQVQDIILSILCIHPVNHKLLQSVWCVDPGEDGPSVDGYHRLPHQLMRPHEAHNFIWEITGGLVQRVICLTGTLQR